MIKKKIAIVITSFSIGGAENMVYGLLQNLNQSKYDIRVFVLEKKSTILEEKVSEIAKLIVPPLGISNLRKIIWLLIQLMSFEPDIVHGHLGGITYSLPYVLFSKSKLVATLHTIPQKAVDGKTAKMLRHLCARKKARIVAVSAENALLCADYFNLGAGECNSINNGVSLPRYYSKEHCSFTFINIGRQDANKNQAAIVRCFAELKKKYDNIFLYLLGDGEKHSELTELVDKLSLTNYVELTGNVADTENYLAISDIYVQSSFREAMPLVVLEAMASGLPVIASNVGGLVDVINGNGFLFEPGDEKQLLSNMERMILSDRTELDKMKSQSLLIVQDYSSEKMTSEYESLYDSIGS